MLPGVKASCVTENNMLTSLRAFAKPWKANIGFVMSVRLSVCPCVFLSAKKKIGLHLTDFYEIWHLTNVRNPVEKNEVSLKSEKNRCDATWRSTYIYDDLSEVILEREIFQTKVVQGIKAHTLNSATVSSGTSCRLWDSAEKYCRAEQTARDNMANALGMLDSLSYTHTLRIYNTYFFFTETMVKRTRLNVMLCLLCLSCLNIFCILSTH